MAQEETSMKKSKSIISLVVILLLLCGAYLYVSKHPSTKENESSSSSTQEALVQLWKVDSAKATKIIINYSKGENTFVKNANAWVIENYNHKLDPTTIASVTDSLLNLSGTVVEKNATDIDKYGLGKPIINVQIVGDGADKKLFIGDKTSDGSNYYASVNGNKDVYFIPSSAVDNLTLEKAAYRDKTITAIDPATLSYMKINQALGSPIEIKRNMDQSEEETEYNLNTWILTGSYSVPIAVADQKFSELVASIPNLQASGIVEDNPRNLSLYGLDKPSLELTLKDSKNTIQLLIGKNKDDNNVYFKTAQVNTIYLIDKSIIDSFRLKPFDVITKFAYLVNIETVDKIVVDVNGQKDTVLLSRTSAKAEKAGDPDVITTISKVNDKVIEISKFKKQYQEIVGLIVDAENDKVLVNKPEVSITYSLNKGSKKQETVDFVSYNDEFYAVFRNGKSDFVITKDKVKKMITSLKNLK